MAELVWPALFALFLWWAGTGLVLYLDGLARRTHRWTLLAAAGVALAALHGLAASSASATPAGAYLAFACAVAIFGALELAYYLGFVTGVHRTPCPPGCSPWRRFALALGASVYHELSLVAGACVVLAATAQGENAVGLHTYLVLWLMRWSAKLNLFLGVSNFHQEWLPAHLRYVVSYIPKRRMNLLFPVSVSAATALAALLVAGALSPHAGEFQRAGHALVATLLVLAVVEHWFLVLPLPDDALWRWAIRSGSEPRRVPPAGTGALLEAGGARIGAPVSTSRSD